MRQKAKRKKQNRPRNGEEQLGQQEQEQQQTQSGTASKNPPLVLCACARARRQTRRNDFPAGQPQGLRPPNLRYVNVPLLEFATNVCLGYSLRCRVHRRRRSRSVCCLCWCKRASNRPCLYLLPATEKRIGRTVGRSARREMMSTAINTSIFQC